MVMQQKYIIVFSDSVSEPRGKLGKNSLPNAR